MKHRLLPTKSQLYHGIEGVRPYFEGWYFKHVSKRGKLTIAVICGISKVADEKNDHSFIQIITGPVFKSYYIKFKPDEFTYNKYKFEIQIGKNHFSNYKIHLDIENCDIKIAADLKYFRHIFLEKNIFILDIFNRLFSLI